MFKQVRSGWPKAIRSIRNSVNTGPMDSSAIKAQVTDAKIMFMCEAFFDFTDTSINYSKFCGTNPMSLSLANLQNFQGPRSSKMVTQIV